MARQTKMPAARSVSDEPAVETSWAIQRSEKSRRRKTANIDGAGQGRGQPRRSSNLQLVVPAVGWR